MSTMETWENGTLGRVVIKKFGADGKLRDEVVAGGRTFHITEQERRINQEMAATQSLDIFTNGVLQPNEATMKLLDGTESAREIAENPNFIGEADLKALVKSHWKALQSRLQEIDQPHALVRLLEIAKETDASYATVSRIQERLQEVSPTSYTEVVTVGGPVDTRSGIKPVTPR